jgi:hypothetical protein
MNKKLLWTIVGLVVVVGTFIGLKKTGVIGKDEGLNVSAEKAALRTIIETVNASGKVYPEIEVKVSPDVSGEIIELNVKEIVFVKDRFLHVSMQIFILPSEISLPQVLSRLKHSCLIPLPISPD